MAQDSGVRLDTRPLDRIARDLQRRAGRVVAATAETIATRTKVGAPVKTGRLRASYHAQPVATLEWEVGTNVDYAPYQEFGTSKMAAHPHFVPAIEQTRRDLPNLVAALFEA